MRKFTYLSIMCILMGCASCPFIDPQGNMHDDYKWVGGSWLFNRRWLPWQNKIRISCAEAQALGHPEWHRMDADIVIKLIEHGELDKFRYSPSPALNKDLKAPAGWYYDSDAKKWRFKYPP